MTTILHLSDLHLGDEDPWERATEDKVGLVPQQENTRLSVIRTSLMAIQRHLKVEDTDLDALIVSGDITSQHDRKGFERFVELLDEVGLVKPEQILVVPGNHDVDWSCEPGTPGKYESFLEHTRRREMRTPLCDGIDFTPDPADSEADPVLVLDNCVLVGINSANWCGVRLGSGRRTRKPSDVARVSEEQLQRLTDVLRGHDFGDRVRIAVLHHHLLPVTEDEEVKDFESFTNLARLRAWLRDHGFHVVLHGHKHQSTITWDHVHELADHNAAARRILIVAAPRPTSWGHPLCRLIRAGESAGRRAVPHAPRVTIETVQAERHERPIQLQRTAVQLDPGAPSPAGFVAIDAPTADAAYEQLIDALERHPGRLLNVTCVVRDASSALTPPTNFTGDIAEPKVWLEDAATWWQRPSPALVAAGEAPFNHGERLYAPGPEQDPLERAALRLGSTKAMVLVLREGDLRTMGEAPAFVAVQLVKAGNRLDCVGYFRKQDLTLWWPVNVAELAKIQMRVLDLGADKRMEAGRLVTIAVEAIHDNVLPQVAGTTVDRFVDLRPELLMEMAYGAAHPSVGHASETAQLWRDVLGDIGPTQDFPSLGIKRLLEHLRVFRDVGEKEHLALLIKRLEAVYNRAHRARHEARTRSARNESGEQLRALVAEVLNAVDEALTTAPGPASPSPSV